MVVSLCQRDPNLQSCLAKVPINTVDGQSPRQFRDFRLWSQRCHWSFWHRHRLLWLTLKPGSRLFLAALLWLTLKPGCQRNVRCSGTFVALFWPHKGFCSGTLTVKNRQFSSGRALLEAGQGLQRKAAESASNVGRRSSWSSASLTGALPEVSWNLHCCVLADIIHKLRTIVSQNH